VRSAQRFQARKREGGTEGGKEKKGDRGGWGRGGGAELSPGERERGMEGWRERKEKRERAGGAGGRERENRGRGRR
jgi:hypothetical protein